VAAAAKASGGTTDSAARERPSCTSRVTTPQPRISETTSASNAAVAIAFAAKIAHSSRSRPSVSRTSLYALRRMMAMTAAPMP
jgi:hypothetical protein